MQDEHAFIWEAMVATVDVDLRRRRVLDVGCNQGGFLRMLVDRAAIREGYGYDPAAGAIDDARRLAGSRPLTFEVASSVPAGWVGFDVAFSHEVLYLLPDLPAHAASMHHALTAGGCYFATMGVHAGSRLMSAWHAANAEALGLPRLYRLDEVAGAFEPQGFEVSTARLKLNFVPVRSHRNESGLGADLLGWLDYYNQDKVLFRFRRI